MYTSFHGGNNDLGPDEASRRYGIDPERWIPVPDSVALQSSTLEEYESMVQARINETGIAASADVYFAYPQHLLPMVSDRGRQLAGSDSVLRDVWDREMPDLGVMRQELSEPGLCAPEAVSRRSFVRRASSFAAALLFAVSLGTIDNREGSASHCDCCKWQILGSSGLFTCASYWYEVSNCSTYCYRVLVGSFTGGTCAGLYGSCRLYR